MTHRTTGALDGRVALVTGSSRGIGAAIARLFAQHGAAVAVHGRDRAALASVRADIERAGGRAIDVVADVTRFAEIDALRRRVEGELGPTDVLVANAGANLTGPGVPIEETTEEGWRATVDTNLTATFLTLKCILPAVQTKLAEEHPIHRLGTPNDVARAALYLASDESTWITGIILDVAGGAVMR